MTPAEKEIGRWSDATPILLLPVRIETRFKSIPADGGTAEELWVRIYPDDCSVDTFEAALSDTELASARQYWIDEWAAGGIDGQRRAAWRNLVASHGPGRAAWIVQQFVPAGAPPQKANDTDIVLVIATDAPPEQRVQDALSLYWTAIWRADADRDKVIAATQALENSPGVVDPDALIRQFPPANLAAKPAAPAKRADVAVSVQWLSLPAATAEKTRSWTAPARVNVLPDRFVVLGYQHGELVFEQAGGIIPPSLVAGPDPSAPPEQQLRHDADGNLTLPDEMRWMADFDAAVAAGMGIKVALNPDQVDLTQPLERVVVIGLRLADDAAAGQARLEELLDHHRYGQAGFALLRQGTPTNNTDEASTRYSRVEDADAAFDALFGPTEQLTATSTWWQRQDGQWLADALGVAPSAFDRVPGAGARDFGESRAMNRALWPATLGYTMQTELHPVFAEATAEATRWFYTHFVAGRGMLPAIRIGKQPYGILPISAVSKWKWLGSDQLTSVAGLDPPAGLIAYRQGLAAVLARMRSDWSALAAGVNRIGRPGDAHQLLLDVIGLHPASAEFHQRYAESLDHVFNLAKFSRVAGQLIESLRSRNLTAAGLELLRHLGYTGPLSPDALSRFFFTRANRLNGAIVDDRPLSESVPIRSYAADGRNYVRWLADAARGSFEDVRQERGFTDGQAPDALLYVMLRHAILLAYWDTSLQLLAQAGALSAADAATARRESSFVHVAADGVSESRFAPLYSRDVRVTQTPDRTVAEYIGTLLPAAGARSLQDALDALELLADVPTARLERCLAEHLDTASYRLDAWLLGLVHYQLAALRYGPGERGDKPQLRRGIYLGAFGCVENLRREPSQLQPVVFDGELGKVFTRPDQPPLIKDPANGGYVTAPSINHATTAAILRAGYLANASTQDPDALGVDLSSARVRKALGIIEGIRNGQPLGALLGYRLQRGLHEGHPGVELDSFVYPLRKQFPLVADQMASTISPPGVPIESVEANNVIDGLKLLEHIRASGSRPYPFGLPLPPASPAQRAAIDAEVDGLIDAHDAIADLALAEGVHQAVLGNYDRVSSTLDAYSKGTFPPSPDVVRTPRSGFGLTHRVGLHFAAGADPGQSPLAGIPVSPRSQAQAMVNKWLSTVLPDPDLVGCLVRWVDPITQTESEAVITQKLLQLQPIDLLYIVTLDSSTALSELDDRILAAVAAQQPALRPDAVVSILHTARLPSPLKSFFEVAPLIRHLRSLVHRSRVLAPTDLIPTQQASRAHDAALAIDPARVKTVRDALDVLRQDLEAAVIAAPVDQAITTVIALFQRAARFGIQQVGWGFLYEWRRAVFADLLTRLRTVLSRWNTRLADFNAGLTAYDPLALGMTEDERFSELGRLDLLVSAAVISPRPNSAADYRAQLPARAMQFGLKRDQLEAIFNTVDPRLDQLLARIHAALPADSFDRTPFSVQDAADNITRFIADLADRVTALTAETQRRLTAAGQSIQASDSSAEPGARVAALQAAASALLGPDLTLIPEFTLPADAAADTTNALAVSTSGALTQYVSSLQDSEFPVDDWMHGVSRVREKIYAWEQAVTLSEVFGSGAPELTPLQLPYHPGEGWLAADFDPATVLDGERLLYTAHFPVPWDPAQPTCGVLVDEWTEIIPARDETVGLAFNYNQPGCEAPQAWLLVTPAQMEGRWQWADLVDAVHEALDLARLRAVEPGQLDASAYAAFLPATTSASLLYPISIGLNYARVNSVMQHIAEAPNG